MGRITQLPDSQQLFGALAYLIKELAGEEVVSNFVERVRNYELNFTLSSLMPSGYLPIPQSYLQDQITDKETYKMLKRCEFLRPNQLGNLLLKPENSKEITSYIAVEEKQQIHASIESTRYNLPGLSPNVYSLPELTILEKNNKDSEVLVTEFEFHYTANDICPLFAYLKQAKENGSILTLGPRSSQGLNLYSIQAVEEETIRSAEGTNFYLNLGRLLPNKINFQKSYLKLFTSERRPFQNWGNHNKKELRFVSFIESGSIIQLDQNADIYSAGKSIKSPFDRTGKSITFGQSFLYPVAIKEVKNEQAQ